MSHSRPVAVKLPPDLAEACQIRAEALGYASLSAYLKGLIRYDLLVQGPHTITLPIAQLRPEKQDAVDSKLLRITQAGVGERGQLLTRILERVKEPANIGAALAEPEA
jgi:hypothetical protein